VGAKKRNGVAGSTGAGGSTGATGSLTGIGSLGVLGSLGDEPEPRGCSAEDGSEAERFPETLGLVPLAFDFFRTHDLPVFRRLPDFGPLPALRRLPPRAPGTHLVGRAGDDLLLLVRRREACEEAGLCERREAAA
jgi:hypothetical protein